MELSHDANGSVSWLEQRSIQIIDAWLAQLPGEPLGRVPEDELRALAAAGIRSLDGGAASDLNHLQRKLAELRSRYDLPIPVIVTALKQLGEIIGGVLPKSAAGDGAGQRAETWQLAARWSDMLLNCALYLSQELDARYDAYRVQATALLRVAQAVSSSLDLHDVLVRVGDELMDLLGCRCTTFLMDDQGNLQYVFAEPPPAQYVAPNPPESFTMEAYRRKAPVYCYDAALDPLTDKETVRFFGLKSLLSVPFIYRERVVAVGLLAPWPYSYRRFTQEELDLVQVITNTAAVAIENARLHQRTELLAVTQERNRLAWEIHDNLAQTLALLKLQITGLLAEDVAEPVRQTLQEMKEMVGDAYVDLRDTIFAMGAFRRAGGNLAAELQAFASTFAAHHHLIAELDVSQAAFDSIPSASLGARDPHCRRGADQRAQARAGHARLVSRSARPRLDLRAGAR